MHEKLHIYLVVDRAGVVCLQLGSSDPWEVHILVVAHLDNLLENIINQ